MASQKSYRVCIIGLSGIGARPPLADGDQGMGNVMPHTHIHAYHHLPELSVVGICDLNEQLIEETKNHWSEIYPGLQGFTDYRQMIASLSPDILSVVTSDNRHADIVVDAASMGVRAIFCEKPIATNLADADRMIEAVEKHRTVMSVNHSRRWMPVYRAVKSMLDDGAIGELKRIQCNFGGPRAILFRNGTHMIDTICYLADAPPAWVFAELDEGYEDYWPYMGDGGRNPDLEPGCSGYIHFKNGVRAYYNGSKGVIPRQGFELTGTSGWIFVHEKYIEIDAGDGIRTIVPEGLTHFDSVASLRELITVMENGGETISPPGIARHTLEIILGFLASQKHGNNRIDFPLDETTV
jgi:predicted dehydrogenase